MTSAEFATCSASATSVHEPLPGTAPLAKAWLAIEQEGPFGRDALTQSHFPSDLARALLARLDGTGVRPALIRRVGRHADTHTATAARRVYLAASQPGKTGLATNLIDDPAALLDIDFHALADGDLSGAWPQARVSSDPLLLICTHAKRDVCCAVHGLPLARAAHHHFGSDDAVWETSHLGGHRFAPTAVQLPHGWVHGRLDLPAAIAVLESARRAAPEVPIGCARGRSSLRAAAQAADIHVRMTRKIVGIDDTRVVQIADDLFEVSVPQDGPVRVSVTPADLQTPRRESCAKPPVIGRVFHTTIL